MNFQFKTKGVCSKVIDIELEGDIVKSVEFASGCDGNLKAIGALVSGLKIDEVIARLGGIKCDYKSTSCPDQLALALKEYKNSL